MQRSLKDYIIISLKGLSMGAADAVPGVSGGTIALISGIYSELLETINSISLKTFKTLVNTGFKPFWNAINGNFILALGIGILISFVSVMQLARFLLIHHPIKIWAFFFGLIVASVFLVGKQIKNWRPLTILAIIIGAAVAYFITTLPALSTNDSMLFLFLAAMLAICAMILPGISGSFILLILGAYKPLSDAVHDLDFKRIIIFITGAIVGLLSFSKLLKWLLNSYKNTTLAVLTGFIVGSLNKVWPWKQTTVVFNELEGNFTDFDSLTDLATLSVFQTKNNMFEVYKTISEHSISPFKYEQLNGVSAELPLAIGLMLAGFFIIFGLERIGKSSS